MKRLSTSMIAILIWCEFYFRTALAEAELEYNEFHKSPSVYLQIEIKNVPKLQCVKGKRYSILWFLSKISCNFLKGLKECRNVGLSVQFKGDYIGKWNVFLLKNFSESHGCDWFTFVKYNSIIVDERAQ